VIAAEGKIHVIGGRKSTSTDRTGQHDIYDPATNTWTAGPPLPTPRSAMGAVLYKGLILVNGGEMQSGTFNENEGYDVKAGAWRTLAPLPSARHGQGGTVVGDNAYFVGGALQPGGTGNTDQLIMFHLP
jgi:hypothetical protein